MTQTPRFPRGPVLALVALAFALRCAHLYALAQTPFFTGLVVDALGYQRDAHSIRGLAGMTTAFYRPPLYAYLRAALTAVGLGSPWALGLVHACVGAVTAGLCAVITFRLTTSDLTGARRRLSACCAAAIAATYGPWVVFDVEMLPPVWIHFLIASALLAATSRRASAAPDTLGGSLIGVASTGWAPAAVLAVPLIALRATTMPTARRRGRTLAFIAAMSCGPALTAWHNAQHGAPGILVSANLGINLWLGNAPHWRDTLRMRPGIQYDLEYRRPTLAGAVSLPERERYFLELVRDTIAAAPLAAATRTAEKFYLFWHGREIRRDRDIAWLRSSSSVARNLVWEQLGLHFPFGLLLPLALSAPRRYVSPRTHAVLLAGVALYGLLLSGLILGGRYRLPIVVLLIPLAATRVAALLTACQLAAARVLRRAERQPAGSRQPRPCRRAVAFVLALLVCNIPNAYSKTFAASETELLLLAGQAYQQQHELGRALAETQRAVLLAPDDADAQLQLGRLHLSLDEPWSAARAFRAAGQLEPTSEAPWILHAHAMLALGRYEDAVYSLQEALARNPNQSDALRDLAASQALSGRPQLAMASWRRYVAAGYDDARAGCYVAQALLDSHAPSQALELLALVRSAHGNSAAVESLAQRATRMQQAATPPRGPAGLEH